MIEKPLVSVLTRTKNRPERLERALKSVTSQTYRPIEVVVVNDGGCDIDDKKLEKVLNSISFKYIQLKESRGRAGAGNVCIDNGEGEYFGFLDDDDIYYPNCLSTLVEASHLHNRSFVYGQCDCIEYSDNSRKHLFTMGQPFDMRELFYRNFIPINSFIFKRECLTDVGGMDGNFEILEDWDFIFRMARGMEPSKEPLYVDVPVSEYSIFGSATITAKGGQVYHDNYRDIFYKKHASFLHANAFDYCFNLGVLQGKNDLQGYLHTLEEELNTIKNSKAWKAILFYRKIKNVLVNKMKKSRNTGLV